MTEWLKRDWGLKLLSLVLALGLWTYAVSEEGVEVQRRIPLKIVIQNSHMSILDTSTDTLEVTLVAPRGLLSDLASEQIVAIHEIEEAVKTAGKYSFRVEPDEIKLPKSQIRVTSIEPEIVQVRLDEVIVKKLPVEPQYGGDPAFGYKVVKEEIQLDPNAIMVEGPKGQLEKFESIATEKIDLVGRIRSFRRTLSVQLPSNVKALTETLIDAYIPIRDEFEEKEFKDIAVKVLRSAENEGTVEVKPDRVSFFLKGSKRQFEKLLPETILCYIDASLLDSGVHKVPVNVLLPEEVNLRDGPPVVEVTIKRK